MAYSDRLHVKSAQRSSGTSSDFRINLPSKLLDQTYYLNQVSMPISYYNVSTADGGRGNNFYFTDTAPRVGVLPVGNYTSTTLPAALQTAMNAVGSQVYAVALSSLTQKITVTGTSAFAITMASGTVTGLGGAGAQMTTGFTTDMTAATSQTSDSIANLTPVSNIGILIESTSTVEDVKQQPSTFIIPVTGNGMSWITYTPPTNNKQYMKFPKYASNLRITLYDENFQPFDLNGVDWSMILSRMDAPKMTEEYSGLSFIKEEETDT